MSFSWSSSSSYVAQPETSLVAKLHQSVREDADGCITKVEPRMEVFWLDVDRCARRRDAAVYPREVYFGLDFVIRNYEGVVVAALARRVNGVLSVENAELTALYKGFVLPLIRVVLCVWLSAML
ncbi:hypothetical protein TorRG33x02_168350 [Trema orientale]|uniref:Uncharacterized protein n=1 Tax=Trema orientale TaxID=63057 RepID=A0A2P5EP71_TREOI|nr:hypothetical protein TorRG33x02_168350 [Trema orientale]